MCGSSLLYKLSDSFYFVARIRYFVVKFVWTSVVTYPNFCDTIYELISIYDPMYKFCGSKSRSVV